MGLQCCVYTICSAELRGAKIPHFIHKRHQTRAMISTGKSLHSTQQSVVGRSVESCGQKYGYSIICSLFACSLYTQHCCNLFIIIIKKVSVRWWCTCNLQYMCCGRGVVSEVARLDSWWLQSYNYVHTYVYIKFQLCNHTSPGFQIHPYQRPFCRQGQPNLKHT